MAEIVTVGLVFRTITCCARGCGMTFAVPAWWDEKRREDHSDWYCPHGHLQHFAAETDAERLRRENVHLRDQLDAERANAEAALAAERRAKAESRRLKRRAAGGVCPCCKRTFSELARHMATKHPQFVAAQKG